MVGRQTRPEGLAQVVADHGDAVKHAGARSPGGRGESYAPRAPCLDEGADKTQARRTCQHGGSVPPVPGPRFALVLLGVLAILAGALALQTPRPAESDVSRREAPKAAAALDTDDPAFRRAVRDRLLDLARRSSDDPPRSAPLTDAEKEPWRRPLPRPEFEAPAQREGRQRHERSRERRRGAEAHAERRRSRNRHRRLDRNEALKVAREQLPGVVDRPAWRALELGRGERLGAFQGRDGALIEVPGKDGEDRMVVAESTVPLRSAAGSGKPEPVDLSLHDRGAELVPENPLVRTRDRQGRAPGRLAARLRHPDQAG